MNATAQDLDMFKRLKRLQKFDDTLKQKNKQVKPSLITGQASNSSFNYGGPAQMAYDESEMGLDEYAKHASVKVSPQSLITISDSNVCLTVYIKLCREHA